MRKGELTRWLVAHGARSVIGVDASTRMLGAAKASNPHPRIRYEQAFIEDFDHARRSIDFVVSSLALHYVADLSSTMRRIASWLAPGGRLIASVVHPLVSAGASTKGDGWRIRGYAEEGPRRVRWLKTDVTQTPPHYRPHGHCRSRRRAAN